MVEIYVNGNMEIQTKGKRMESIFYWAQYQSPQKVLPHMLYHFKLTTGQNHYQHPHFKDKKL